MFAEALIVTRRLDDVLDALGVRWAVGGSLASSLQGIPRATQDVDLIAELTLPLVRDLVVATERDFYVDEDAVRDAVRRRASFSFIDLATMLKVDVFVPKGDPLSTRQLHRAALQTLEGGIRLPVLSAEDVILQKLRWFRQSGETSERQWRDVLGVLLVGAGRLDLDDLRAAARAAGLDDLLERVLAESSCR